LLTLFDCCHLTNKGVYVTIYQSYLVIANDSNKETKNALSERHSCKIFQNNISQYVAVFQLQTPVDK